MVIYDLVCSNHHGFEGWFKNSDDYLAQQDAELVRCPVCDSHVVKRKPSTLKIASNKSNIEKEPIVSAELQKKLGKQQQLQKTEEAASAIHFTSTAEQAESIRNFIENNFEDVGDELPNEVRKMHYGEIEHRGIRGQASSYEVSDLAEEGIDLFSVPIGAKNKKDLN